MTERGLASCSGEPRPNAGLYDIRITKPKNHLFSEEMTP
jgi:hypothetical protein